MVLVTVGWSGRSAGSHPMLSEEVGGQAIDWRCCLLVGRGISRKTRGEGRRIVKAQAYKSLW